IYSLQTPGRSGNRSLIHPAGEMRKRILSTFAHTFGRLGSRSGTHLLFDATSDVGIDIFPVIEGAFQYRAAHAAEQAARYLVNQFGALLVVEYLAYQGAGLTKVIVFGMQGISAAYQFAVRLPAVLCRPR